MITYLTIALLISGICGLSMLALRKAPARLRFYICLLVLATWMTPWQLLQFQAESSSFTLPLNILTNFTLTDVTATNASLSASSVDLPKATTSLSHWLWLTLFSIGFVLFFKDLICYAQLHKRWIKHSMLDNQVWKTVNIPQSHCDIRRINTQAPGMTTGLRKPIIWLNSEQHDVDKLRTIVLHELTHIRQHDPYWLWLINLVQRLFWWNPLIWFTARYARQQIELSCDEQCKKHLPDGSYQQQLIKLTIAANKQQESLPMPAVLQMSGTGAFNLKRIHKLNEEHIMKKRYVIVMATLLSLTSWIGFSNATINTQQSVEHASNSGSLVDVLHSINNKDFTGAQTLLDKIATNIDSLEVSDQAKIWKLYAHVLFELDVKNPHVIAYIDKALALEEGLTTTQFLSILNMAQALAASQERWDKQLSYANKWFETADDTQDNKQLLYMTAVSHYSLQQFDTASTLLNKLVLVSETQGQQPKENWLKLLMAIYMQNEDKSQAFDVQEKITSLYPSKKNEKLLKDLAYML